MKGPSANILAVLSIAFLAALVIGWKLAPEADVQPPEAETGPAEAGIPLRDRPSRTDSGVARKMDRIRNAATPVERSRAAISLAMSLDPSEFAAWVEGDRFSNRNGPELSIFRMIIFERWAAEDPDSLIAWGIHNDHGQAGRALDTFAKDDPERLIAHFREHPDDTLELTQLGDIAKSHPSLALSRLRELYESGVTSELDRKSREVLLVISEKGAAELEAVLDSLPEAIRAQAESVLIGRKLEKDFAGEIGKLFSDPQGAEIFHDNMALLKGRTAEIIAAVPGMPESWLNNFASNPWRLFQHQEGNEWLEADLEGLGFSKKQADDIRETGYGYLSYSHPGLVLKNITYDEKSRRSLESAVANLFRRGESREAEAQRVISEITNPEAREAATGYWKALVAGRMLKKTDDPAEWFQSLAGIAAPLLAENVATQLRSLDGRKLEEYRAGFNALPAGAKDTAALSIAKTASNSNASNAVYGDAIRYLANNPPATDPAKKPHEQFQLSRSASAYTVNLAMENPVKASEWVGSLPEGNTREWAAKNLAKYWNQYDPTAVSGWMKSLPGKEREQVQAYLKTGW